MVCLFFFEGIGSVGIDSARRPLEFVNRPILGSVEISCQTRESDGHDSASGSGL